MVEVVSIKIEEGDSGCRVDRWFKRHHPSWPFTAVARLIRTGQVRLDSRRVKVGEKLEAGQFLRFPMLTDLQLPSHPPSIKGSKLAALLRKHVIYQDDHIIVLNKPYDVAVQGGSKIAVSIDDASPFLVADGAEKPRIVHRLDRQTSGLLLLACSAQSAAALANLFKHQQVQKSYLALWLGVPKVKCGTINKPLAKTLQGNFENMQCLDKPGEHNAITDYQVLDYALNQIALVRLAPHTGRMHQLRAHSQSIGHPIVGDHKYRMPGKKTPHGAVDKLHLVAHKLSFTLHGKHYEFTAPPPDFFIETMHYFGLAL